MHKTIKFAAAIILGVGLVSVGGLASVAADDSEQRLLAPGLFVYQTRLDHSTCGETKKSGRISTYFAAVHGVPGSRDLEFELVNSKYWPKWKLQVVGKRKIVGSASNPKRQMDAQFEMIYNKKERKFRGRGSRGYMQKVDGKKKRCITYYDTVLRTLEVH